MTDTSQLELKAAKQSFSLLIQESLKSNPLIKSIGRVLCRVSDFKELVKAYYFGKRSQGFGLTEKIFSVG